MKVTDRLFNAEIIDLLDIISWKIDSITGNKIAKVIIAALGDKVLVKNSLYSLVAGITGLRLLIHLRTHNFNHRLLAIDV